MRMADQDPEQFFKEAFPTEIPKAEEYITRLEDLVRWLALPYAGRTPIFARVDPNTGYPMPANIRLADTWAAVMGEGDPPVPGVWSQCQGCGSWYVDSTQEPPANQPGIGRVFAYVASEFQRHVHPQPPS